MTDIFKFSFPDFSYSFLSILLEGVPFLLLGTILSGLLDQFLPARLMARLLPRNPFAGALASGLLGIVFPMCECGIVPVIRRLMAKGLPVSNAITYMLAAPIVNPIVAVSTMAAFRGQEPLVVMLMRLGLGFFVAAAVGLVVHHLPLRLVLRPSTLAEIARPSATSSTPSGSMSQRLWAAFGICVSDFLGMALYFVVGAAVAATFNTAVNQDVIVPLACNDWLATGSLMGLAVVLSLCSTTDAFIAATFTMFPTVAKLGFLVFGPMIDLKLIFIYSAVFRRRFVLALAVGLFVFIGLLCIRLQVVFTKYGLPL